MKTRGDNVLPRDEHSAVVDEVNGVMIIFGGFQEGSRTNETIIYNMRNNVWTTVKIAEGARKPSCRSGHSAVLHQNVMYIFGGKTDNSVKLNDIWALNLQTLTWN